MIRMLSFLVFFCFMSACSMLTEDNESQTAETPALANPVAEIQPVESDASMPLETVSNDTNQVASAANKTMSKQEIKLIQTQLKATGFDPGPLDGVLGGKTISALRRLRSGCANLKDLFDNPTGGILPQSGETQTAKQSAAERVFGTDEIRLIQVRLKDAGFDAGPVDGVMGSRTKSALLRFQSGCTMVKDLPPTLENQAQTSERMLNPTPASQKQNQPAISKPSPTTESARDEAGKVNVATDKSPSQEEIRALQTQLKAAGFDPGPIDGMLGPKTKAALQQYRTVQGSATSRKVTSGIGLKFDY